MFLKKIKMIRFLTENKLFNNPEYTKEDRFVYYRGHDGMKTNVKMEDREELLNILYENDIYSKNDLLSKYKEIEDLPEYFVSNITLFIKK